MTEPIYCRLRMRYDGSEGHIEYAGNLQPYLMIERGGKDYFQLRVGDGTKEDGQPIYLWLSMSADQLDAVARTILSFTTDSSLARVESDL